MLKFPNLQIHYIVLVCLLTFLVYKDSRKHHVKYRNLWVLGTAFWAPIAVVYAMVRFVTAQKFRLTKRQRVERDQRKAAAEHSKTIRVRRRAWELEELKGRYGKSPAQIKKEAAAKLAKQEAERQKLRENLDDHARRRAERMKLRK